MSMTGFARAARWVIEGAMLGKSSDRGEPECFRPARTSALAEAGDHEICRRGPGAARSAESFAGAADRRSAFAIGGLTWAHIKSNVLKENPRAHDGAGVGSRRSFLHYGRKQS